MSADFVRSFLGETVSIVNALDPDRIEAVAQALAAVRARGGRLFILGVGGSAGHASHAVNDFRKICGLESYAPTDNVSELTARINELAFEWLDAPVRRVAAHDVPLPYSPQLEDFVLPQTSDIVRAARWLAAY